MTDLAIARRCGWRLEWVRALDEDEYDILLETLLEETATVQG